MGNSKWYWLRPDHSIELGPEIEDTAAFAEYAKWLYGKDDEGKFNKVVARTEIGDTLVSTVFLGLDHNHADTGPPLLFETLVMGGPNDQDMYRYRTWDKAIEGHERICREQVSGISREELENAKTIIEALLKE